MRYTHVCQLPGSSLHQQGNILISFLHVTRAERVGRVLIEFRTRLDPVQYHHGQLFSLACSSSFI